MSLKKNNFSHVQRLFHTLYSHYLQYYNWQNYNYNILQWREFIELFSSDLNMTVLLISFVRFDIMLLTLYLFLPSFLPSALFIIFKVLIDYPNSINDPIFLNSHIISSLNIFLKYNMIVIFLPDHTNNDCIWIEINC